MAWTSGKNTPSISDWQGSWLRLESPGVPSNPARSWQYSGNRPRELTHDAQVYRAYLKDADRLREEGAFIRRVILDYELKREYQRFLQERNRGKSESDGAVLEA